MKNLATYIREQLITKYIMMEYKMKTLKEYLNIYDHRILNESLSISKAQMSLKDFYNEEFMRLPEFIKDYISEVFDNPNNVVVIDDSVISKYKNRIDSFDFATGKQDMIEMPENKPYCLTERISNYDENFHFVIFSKLDQGWNTRNYNIAYFVDKKYLDDLNSDGTYESKMCGTLYSILKNVKEDKLLKIIDNLNDLSYNSPKTNMFPLYIYTAICDIANENPKYTKLNERITSDKNKYLNDMIRGIEIDPSMTLTNDDFYRNLLKKYI